MVGKSLKQIESSRGEDCYLAQSYSVSNTFGARQVQIPPGPKRLAIVHALKAKRQRALGGGQRDRPTH